MKASFFFFFFYLVISLYLLNNILLAAVYDAYKAQLRVQLQTFYRKKAAVLMNPWNDSGILGQGEKW